MRNPSRGSAGFEETTTRPAAGLQVQRRDLLVVACLSCVAAIFLVVIVHPTVERTELSPPFVLGGGKSSSAILQELSYDHAADRRRFIVGRRYIAAGGARGRHVSHRGRVAGRAQQLDEVDPDDPEYGTYKWRDPKTLPQEENTFDTDEYDSKPHEWKGAGEPEENTMDYEGSTDWPDEPKEGTYKWRDPSTLKEEGNTFDTDEYDSKPHEWKGAGEPEENVFENIMQEDSASTKAHGGQKQAALARIHEKAGQQQPMSSIRNFGYFDPQAAAAAVAQQRAAPVPAQQQQTPQQIAQRGDDLDKERLEAAGTQEVKREQQALETEVTEAKAFATEAMQKQELEGTLAQRDKQLASVTKQLLAEKARVAQVEKEAQGHIWRTQHSPVNVLKTVYPDIKWKWHKNVEHLPSAIFDNLESKPVLWHKYRPEQSHILDYLSTAPVEWHAQTESYNALKELPEAAHEWHKQPEEVNVLSALPDGAHQWRQYEGEDNVLASLPSEAHAWSPQKEDKNVLESLNTAEHKWTKGQSAPEEAGQNVLDTLPSDTYKWKIGEDVQPTNVLAGLPTDTQRWHKYTPPTSPLDQLPDSIQRWHKYTPPTSPLDQLKTHYTWKGPGPPSVNPMDSLKDTPHEWKGYTADKSPLDELPDHEYTWKGPGAPDVNPLDQLNDKPHLWKGPRLEQDVNPMRALNDAPHTWSATPASVTRSKNVLDSLNAQPHVWTGPGSEGPNPIDALDSSKWKWKGPGAESANVLAGLRSDAHKWHGYVEPVNVLASLPTCIGLGCGQTINDVGQGIGRGAPV